jgi:hypothetical protein
MKMISKQQLLVSLKARVKESNWDIIIPEKLLKSGDEFQLNISQFMTTDGQKSARDASDIFVYLKQIDGMFYKIVPDVHAIQLLIVPFKLQDAEGTFTFTRKRINFRSGDKTPSNSALEEKDSSAPGTKSGSEKKSGNKKNHPAEMPSEDMMQKKADKAILDRHIKPLNEVISELHTAFARCSPAAQLILGYINLNIDIHASSKDAYYYTVGDKQVQISMKSIVLTQSPANYAANYSYAMEKSNEITEYIDTAATKIMKLHPVFPLFPKINTYFIPQNDTERLLEYIEMRSGEISQLKAQVAQNSIVPDYSKINSFIGIFAFLLGIINILAFYANPGLHLLDLAGYDIGIIVLVISLSLVKYSKIKQDFEANHNLAKIIVDPISEMIDISCIRYMPDILAKFGDISQKAQFLIEQYACWKDDAMEKKEIAEKIINLMRSISKETKKLAKEEFGTDIAPGIYEKILEKPELSETLADLSGAKLRELVRKNYELGEYSFASELLLVRLYLKLLQIIPHDVESDVEENSNEDDESASDNEENSSPNAAHELFKQYIDENSITIPQNLTEEINNWEQSVLDGATISKTQMVSIFQIQKQADVILGRFKKGTIPVTNNASQLIATSEDAGGESESSSDPHEEMDETQPESEEKAEVPEEEYGDEYTEHKIPLPRAESHNPSPDPKVLASATANKKLLFMNKSWEDDFVKGKF